MLAGMKIYTRTGDAGETSLYGGERVSKADLRVAAYGTVDEANAGLGLARSHLSDSEIDRDLAEIQNTLFAVGADLATPLDSRSRQSIVPIEGADVTRLESRIDHYSDSLEPLKSFVLPGGHAAAAALHLARTVVRRAEREVTLLNRSEDVSGQVGVYLNRLSDMLFILARVVNMRAGVSEVRWQVQRRDRAYRP